jgi:hypothetical protein
MARKCPDDELKEKAISLSQDKLKSEIKNIIIVSRRLVNIVC